MAKNIRCLDEQGRIIIPAHIRKALNLRGGNLVGVTMDKEGTILVRVEEERCAICGESVKDKASLELENRQHICSDCAKKIVKAFEK